MYKNLEAEMARKKVTRQDIADTLNITYNTAAKKLRGDSELTFKEACMIRNRLFPYMAVEDLFDEVAKSA